MEAEYKKNKGCFERFVQNGERVRPLSENRRRGYESVIVFVI